MCEYLCVCVCVWGGGIASSSAAKAQRTASGEIENNENNPASPKIERALFPFKRNSNTFKGSNQVFGSTTLMNVIGSKSECQ